MAETDKKLKEITERLEQGVKEIFTSERYTEYLDTMSKFHNYSFNNTLLITMQKPDATLVAGYQAWQKKFNRHVKRGEKGIQIIAPTPVKEKQEIEKIDPDTQEPIIGEDGQPETEIVEMVIPRFRVATVFDVSQTEGEPIAELDVPELTGSRTDREHHALCVGCDALGRVQRLQLTHRLQAERCRGVTDTQHVGSNPKCHRGHRRVILRNLRE